jgi:6-pyruvoyltetrahydropterin/6-carboxytetrahydropterin synthase
MLQTFVEFTFEAAHQLPPHSGLHGHSFKVIVYLTGKPDRVFGWTHNLYDVEAVIEDTRKLVDHKYLNDIEGLEVPSLENVAAWIWRQLNARLNGLDHVVVRRGLDGAGEGCCYSEPSLQDAA